MDGLDDDIGDELLESPEENSGRSDIYRIVNKASIGRIKFQAHSVQKKKNRSCCSFISLSAQGFLRTCSILMSISTCIYICASVGRPKLTSVYSL